MMRQNKGPSGKGPFLSLLEHSLQRPQKRPSGPKRGKQGNPDHCLESLEILLVVQRLLANWPLVPLPIIATSQPTSEAIHVPRKIS